MEKIKVLYIHHHGTGAGASRSLAFLIKNLPADRIDPYIITPPGSATEIFRSVTPHVFEVKELPQVISVAGGKFYTLRLLKTLLHLKNLSPLKLLIRQIRPDIIHLNELSLVLVARLCKKLGYKVVMHARVVLSGRTKLVNYIIKKGILKFTDAVIAIDGSVSQKLNGIKTHIVYNPLHVSPDTISRKKLERSACHVLFLSNLIAYKGLFDLLNAAVLLKDDPHIRIFIAGTNSRPRAFFDGLTGKILDKLGVVQDNERRVAAIIHRHNLKNVNFIGNIKNINEWLEKTDILVFPSHMNGPSRSVFEAGALGIPSIISLADKVEDVVMHGKNGIIIPEKSPARLAEEIKNLAYDKERRNQLGAAARVHFNRLNDPRKSAQDVFQIYSQLM